MTYNSLWLSMTDALHVHNNLQQSLVLKKPSEEEEAARTRRKCTAQILNLGVALFGFSKHIVKTISGALYYLHMSRQCLPRKSLMYLILFTLVVD